MTFAIKIFASSILLFFLTCLVGMAYAKNEKVQTFLNRFVVIPFAGMAVSGLIAIWSM